MSNPQKDLQELTAAVLETVEARIERLEDRYEELKKEINEADKNLSLQIAGVRGEIKVLNSYLKIIGAIGITSVGAIVSVLIAVLFHL